MVSEGRARHAPSAATGARGSARLRARALRSAEGEPDAAAVLSLLEADQIVAAKRTPIGRRTLSPGLRVVLWILRLYVVFMLLVVALQVARSL